MYKRPLFAAAIGFVLGEVCALLAESGGEKGLEWMLSLAGLGKTGKLSWPAGIWIFGSLAGMAVIGKMVLSLWTEMGREKVAIKAVRRPKMGRKAAAGVLLLCIFCAGYGRMVWEINAWKKAEQRIWNDGDAVHIKGRIREIREKENYLVLTVKTKDRGNILVYVEKEEERQRESAAGKMLHIGETVEIKGDGSVFQEAKNPGQFDRKAYYRFQGISAAVFAWEVKGSEDGSYSPYLDGLYRFRCFCRRIFLEICEPEDQGIFRAAILGEKDGMDQEINDLYQKNGISHLLAISGLHLSLIGAGFYRILRRCGLGYGGSGFLAAAGIISYGILTGGSASALRAVIMLCVSFLAAYLGRTYDTLSALSLAALMLAVIKPFSIVQSGFQLSFGAILGIKLAGETLADGLGIQKRWMKALAVSLSVQLATGPVVLWHYFQIPVYGVLLNLAVVPLMGYVVISGLMGLGTGIFSYWAGVAAVGTGHYILWLYQRLCEITSRIPGYLLIWGRPKTVQIVFYYLFLGGMLLGLRKIGERRARREENKRSRERAEEKNGTIWGWGIFAAGMVLCGLSIKPQPKSGLDIAVLDVGQGDGIVLSCEGGLIETEGLFFRETRSNKEKSIENSWPAEGKKIRTQQGSAVILMDGGSTSDRHVGENRLEPFLKSKGISCIDFAVVSHGDEDHISGLRYLLCECPEIEISRLILPEVGIGDEGYQGLVDAAQKRGTDIAYMDAGDWIQAGACRLTCFYPQKGADVDFSDRNQQSLVIRADYQDFHMLFTGDVGQEGEQMALNYGGQEEFSSIQVLKAAHHGSKFSSGEMFLAAIHPNWTVLSYEEGNSYGHPHEETRKRLEKEGTEILETGKMGAVLMHVENGKAWYWGYR